MEKSEKAKNEKVDSSYLIDGKYGITDLLDINQLRELFEEFNRATGFTIGFLDHPGLNILIATGWRDICTKFHRVAPKSLENCLKSNHRLLDKLKRPGQVVIEGCKNGMVDCATPIIIEGKHIASLATGQLLLKKPDISRFKKQAEMFGYDEKAYLKALEEVPVVDAQTLKNITKFLGSMAVILSQAGYSRLIHEREIAERKKSEEVLRLKEQLISGVSNNLQSAMIYQMIVKKDGTRKITYLSDSVRKFYGISPEEGIRDYHLIYKRFYKDDQERIHKEEERAIKNFSTFKCEARVNDPSGKVRWSYFVSIPRKLNGDICFDGIEFDITESKEREDKLRESEQKFRDIFNDTNDSIFIHDLNGKILEVNDVACKRLGYSKKELLELNPQKVDSPEFAKNVPLRIKEVLKNGMSLFESVHVSKIGKEIQVEVNAKLIEFKGQKAIISICRDISERKKIEYELRKSKELAEKYLDIDGIIVTIDNDARITMINSVGCNLLGYKKEELIGKNWFRVCLPKEDYENVFRTFKKIISGELKPFEHYENYIVSKKGEKRYVAWHNTILKDDFGKISGTLSSGEDITERKELEEALKKEKERYNLTLDKINSVLYDVDLKTGNIIWDGAIENLTGFESSEFLKINLKGWEKLIHPEDREKTLKDFDFAIRNKKSFILDYRFRKKDGGYFYARDRGVVFYDEAGKANRCLGLILDVSDQKRAEEVLANYNKKLEEDVKKRTSFLNSIVENVPNMIFVKDARDLRFELFNRAGEDLLGYKRESMIGKNDYDFFPKKEADFFVTKDRGVLKSGNLLDIPEEPIDTKSGQRFLHTRKIPILDENGKSAYLLGISEDITERKKSEEKLKESEERFRTLYEGSADAIMILESPGWKFSSGNPAAFKMFNVKDEKEFISFGPWDLSPERQFDGRLSSVKAKEMIEKAMKEGSNLFEWTHKRHKDGEFPAIVLLSRIEIGGKTVLQATVRDISEQKQSELKLKEAFARLKEAEALKSRFLTITSHELKTPLTPAKIQTQMLLEGDLGELNEKQKESFDIILRNINRLSKLIDDILEVSRVQVEGFKLDLQKTQLNEIIKWVVDGLNPVAKNKGLDGISYHSEDLPLVFIDKQRIAEVVTNLLDNAIKFSNKGKISVIVHKTNGDILVEVKDEGVGIPEDAKKSIFEPFFQVEPTFTRKHGGTGLGLSICKAIIEKHGGKMWFESKYGKGSRFYFTLPISKEKKV